MRLEDYLDRFTHALFCLTTSHYKARPALFMIFDGTSSRSSWQAPLHLDRPDLMKEFLLEAKPNAEKRTHTANANHHAIEKALKVAQQQLQDLQSELLTMNEQKEHTQYEIRNTKYEIRNTKYEIRSLNLAK
ncbi:hypothetical protein CYD26_24300 [Pseudomonas sp. FFUP_PS_473]|nr:hypothetical protein CYD26_24300 [Pseudomonas sp. FFUP_PS_473]